MTTHSGQCSSSLTMGRRALVVVVLPLGCGRTKPLDNEGRSTAHRCQCRGTSCNFISDFHVGRLQICNNGVLRTARADEVDTVVCGDWTCNHSDFCRSSAEPTCIAPTGPGGAPDPAQLAELQQTCEDQCGLLGRRQVITFATTVTMAEDELSFSSESMARRRTSRLHGQPPVQRFRRGPSPRDGSSITGLLTRTTAQRSFSSWGQVVTSRWSLSGKQLTRIENAPAQEATCTDSRLTLDGQALLRSEPDLASRLSAASASGNWIQVTY